MTNKRVTLSRPKDRSLQAYKEWMIEFSKRLLGGVDDTITDEEWEQYHKQFWERADEQRLGLDDSALKEENNVSNKKGKDALRPKSNDGT
jgi:hypothetical protein